MNTIGYDKTRETVLAVSPAVASLRQHDRPDHRNRHCHLVPNELRGMVLGAFMVVSAVIGLAVAPMLVTVISSALGGENHLGVALIAISFATRAVAMVGFLGAIRSANFRPSILR